MATNTKERKSIARQIAKQEGRLENSPHLRLQAPIKVVGAGIYFGRSLPRFARGALGKVAVIGIRALLVLHPASRADEREGESRPGVVLLADLGLPDDDGISLIRLCAGIQPACETAVVTVFAHSKTVFACLEADPTGYILKDEMPADIVAQRGPSGKPGDSAALDESVSPRELEILELVAKGLRGVEIAVLLGLSPHTVATHVKNIYRKLSVHSRTEAVFEARGLGLLRH